MHPRFVLVLTKHFSWAHPLHSSAFTQNNPCIQLYTSVIQGHFILKPELFCKRNSSSTAFTWEQFEYKSYTNLQGKKEQDRLGSSCLSLLIATERILAQPGKKKSCTKQTAFLWFSCFLSSKPPSQTPFVSKCAMALLPSMWRKGFFLGHS